MSFIIDSKHNQLVNAKKGELKNFKFHHYSLLMPLILFYNIGYVIPDFIDQTSDEFCEYLYNFGLAFGIRISFIQMLAYFSILSVQ